MILSFTQDQKEYIESQGMLVIEYKQLIYKITGIWENMREQLSKMRTAIKSLMDVFDTVKRKFAEICECIKSAVERSLTNYTVGIEKYEPVFKYMKCNKPYTGVRRIDIRCRSRC